MDEVKKIKINCRLRQTPTSVWTAAFPHISGFTKMRTLWCYTQILIKIYVCLFMDRDLLCIWDETLSSFERKMPKGDDGERQTRLFDANGNSDRWADPRRDRWGGGWHWTDRRKESRRRRAEIRTKTPFSFQVTFLWGFSFPILLLVDLDEATQPPLCHSVCGPVFV